MLATRLTAEQVERGYNNRAAVPEHPYWFEQFAVRSQAAVDALAADFGLGRDEMIKSEDQLEESGR